MSVVVSGMDCKKHKSLKSVSAKLNALHIESPSLAFITLLREQLILPSRGTGKYGWQPLGRKAKFSV